MTRVQRRSHPCFCRDTAKTPDGPQGYSYLGTREDYEEEEAFDVWKVAGRWKQKLAGSEDA
jgi:hypothetical protein